MNEKPIIENTIVTANLTITKEDLVRIRFSEEETRLDGEKTRLEKALEKAREDHKAGCEKFNEAMRKVKVLPDVVKIAKLVNEVFETNYTAGVRAELVKIGDRQEGITLADGKQPKVGDLVIQEVHQLVGSSAQKVIHRRLTEVEAALVKECERLSEAIDKLEAELVEVKQAIAKLPQLQRRAEAEVARRVLEHTPQGKALMASLNANVAGLLPAASK